MCSYRLLRSQKAHCAPRSTILRFKEFQIFFFVRCSFVNLRQLDPLCHYGVACLSLPLRGSYSHVLAARSSSKLSRARAVNLLRATGTTVFVHDRNEHCRPGFKKRRAHHAVFKHCCHADTTCMDYGSVAVFVTTICTPHACHFFCLLTSRFLLRPCKSSVGGTSLHPL